MPRLRALLAALLLSLAVLFAGAFPAPADPLPDGPVLIEGVDLHDVTIRKFGDTYYMYGSVYGCGFQWGVSGTPWCGFGVSTASSLAGSWSTPKLLFSPSSVDPSTGRTWTQTCGGTGRGCFNPRMIERTGWGYDDGVFILWFNAPRHTDDGAANAYNVMGCAGPTGPCGPGVTPNGSFNKPVLNMCPGNGDFGMIESGQGGRPAIVCTEPGRAGLDIQELNWSGSGGNAGVGVIHAAGVTLAEGPGGWWDEVSQRYVLTYSDQGCGYCAGTPIGYAVSSSLYSGWSAPGNVGWGAPAFGRRVFSPNSCGGQPRTVTVLDGRPYQIIDLWMGARNETQAPTLVTPLDYTPRAGAPGDGRVWVPPVSLSCT